MSTSVQAVEVVQSAYAAFGRGDVSAILNLIADDVEWKFCGSKDLPYTGTFRTNDEIANGLRVSPKSTTSSSSSHESSYPPAKR